MKNEQVPILSHTGQAWKYIVGLLMGWLSIIMGISAFLFYSYKQWQYTLLVLSAGAVAITSLVIELTIKCPKCKSRWFFEALKNNIGSNSIIKVRKQTSCPKCGLSNEKHT